MPLIPFEYDTDLWALIAELDLSKEEIRDEARLAYDAGEIDEIDYNKILNRIGY